jgi:hypothetical protein
MENYDSTKDTLKHIRQVQLLLDKVIINLNERQEKHDLSKLESPELEIFDEYTPRLRSSTYGSEQYSQYLKEMKVALDHHYANNSHHPEHYPNGIRGMNLLDLIEMLCDWLAATKRHSDGNIYESIEINQKRFNYSDELKQIFLNTLLLINS